MTGSRPDWEALFAELLRAEDEADVLGALDRLNLLDPVTWTPLGDMENNFSIVSNQQEDATGALVEKIINAIDGNLMAACYALGIDPEGPDAPASMTEAVERLFNVPNGRIGDLSSRQQGELAMKTHLVAVGSKTDPSYLVIDEGEGQTPARFPDTFLSLAKSNKLRIPFVQGKFNAGGTGVLQYCGKENLQLIASKRAPSAFVRKDDDTASEWGFTIVRRLRPHSGAGRRNSMYVYLSPGGEVPHFGAASILAVPSITPMKPAIPYALPLEHGSVIKLYNFRWRAKSIATTEARFELEKFLHAPSLPFRVTETRDYNARYFSTTVSGIWASIGTGDEVPDETEDGEEKSKVEPGFPAAASVTLASVGTLPYRIVVFREREDDEGSVDEKATKKALRRLPQGVFFPINGQVHGKLPADFVSRRLGFAYLEGLFVSVDCTEMDERAREDFFMASRDRVRQNETYVELVERLAKDLKEHPGLKALNSARRAQEVKQALDDEEDVAKTFSELLNTDPALQALFNIGDRLATGVGPTTTEQFTGRRFPTYFRLGEGAKRGRVKHCSVGSHVRVEFQTDAVNDYFVRSESPGAITIEPAEAREYMRLWNGVCSMRFVPPPSTKPGDEIPVTVSVTDPDRESRAKPPFSEDFVIRIEEASLSPVPPPGPGSPKKPKPGAKHLAPRLAMPHVLSVRQPDWEKHKPPFTAEEAFRVKPSGEEGAKYDFFVNLDSKYLLSYLRTTRESQELVVHWFKWGLTLCALGMLRGLEPTQPYKNGATPGSELETRDEGDMTGEVDDGSAPDKGSDVVDLVNRSANALASVIIPIIRNLYKGVGVAA